MVDALETESAQKSNALARDVVFVASMGRGSLDQYCVKLSEHLSVPILRTDMYKRGADLFNKPLVSIASLRGFLRDAAFVRRLRRQGRMVHFGNHHLARYGNFLAQPYIVTVHDLIRYLDARGTSVLIHRPNTRDRLLLKLDAEGIRKARGIVAVSRFTKQEIVKHLGVPEEQIFVVHEGVDHSVFRRVDRRMLPQPYLLFVGSEHPRKNLATLLRAFARLKAGSNRPDLKLVKVGAPGGGESSFRERSLRVIRELGLERDVVFTDRVFDEDLVAYYSGAACLVLPSLYEGFGLPPVEAMACGCPVVVSAAGALPEVVEDAALTFPATDDAALAARIAEVLDDPALNADLRLRGLERSRRFTWRRCAEQTMDVYRAVGRSSL